MSEQPTRVTVDEIEPAADGRLLATLMTDAGDVFVMPLELLPPGVRVGDVLRFDLLFDADETEQRRQHISDLQQRLFGDREREG
jgi:hypothetical protein